MTKVGDKEFTYDANGNMLTDGDRVMHYNAQNQLVKVEMKNATVVEYEYDYTSSRISKKVTKKDPMGKIHEATTYYLGKALEIKDDKFIMHLNQGDRRIVTKSLGQLSDLATSSSSLRPSYIEMDTKPITLMPWLMFIFTFFIIGSFRPIKLVDSGLLKGKQHCHPRESGDPVTRSTPWIPAYAGMTMHFIVHALTALPPFCHPREGGDPVTRKVSWFLICAGIDLLPKN